MLLEGRAFAKAFIPSLKPRQVEPVLDLDSKPAPCVGTESEIRKCQALTLA
jgi:hypothetical protein